MNPFQIHCPKCGAALDLTHEVEEMVNAEARRQAELIGKDKEASVLAAQERVWLDKLSALEMQLAERDDKLRRSQIKAQELEARLTQGSASARGIVAERDLHDYLAQNLPAGICRVRRVGQGHKGTDVIVDVLVNGQPAGRIIIDVKWAANWSNEWPEKVWSDMQAHKADFAYLAVGAAAFPAELKEAGFGFAPCRRAGVKVGVVDANNLALVLALINDTVDKLIRLAEAKLVYGDASPAVKELQDYLTSGYATDLREKARLMHTAVKALGDLHAKVNREHDNILSSLKAYWALESRMHGRISAGFSVGVAGDLPEVPLLGLNGQSKEA